MLVAVCIVALVVVYSGVDDRRQVLALNRDVDASEQITDEMVDVAEINADTSITAISAPGRRRRRPIR